MCPTLQPSQKFSAKVVKLLAKQGPIYIRAVQDIGSWRVYLDCNEFVIYCTKSFYNLAI